MRTAKTLGLALITAMMASLGTMAQNMPVSGIYRIVSGRFNQCCGFVGADSGYALPAPQQSYVRVAVDAQNHTASMSFLGADMRTLFSIVPCPPAGAIDFTFGFGFFLADGSIFFHVDPGPLPYAVYWNYSVSNSGPILRLNGTLGTAQSPCIDVPTLFGHSNVVAELVTGPALTFLSASREDGVRLMVQGTAGHTNVIEASTDLSSWQPVSTNVMDFSLCPICPYAIFQDFAATNFPQRFYRAFETRPFGSDLNI